MIATYTNTSTNIATYVSRVIAIGVNNDIEFISNVFMLHNIPYGVTRKITILNSVAKDFVLISIHIIMV